MRIGEVAHAARTTTKTLRFYEDQGLLPAPGRTPSGYRTYGQAVLGRLDFIRRSRAAGLSLAQIREVLDIRDGGESPCERVTDLLAARLDALHQQIADLKALHETIAALRDRATTTDLATCTPDQVCRYV